MGKELEKSQEFEWLSKENKAIIRKNFFPPSATDLDMQYCISVAKAFNLNPILKQIYFIERRSKLDNGQWITKIEPLAGRDSFLTLAHRSGKFGGIESTTAVKSIPFLNNNGEWGDKQELVATCKVFVKGIKNPIVVSVPYSEYVQKSSKGYITKFWKDKPHTMLKKVAESQALRKAFDITGLYDESEINTHNSNEKQKTEARDNIPANFSKFAKKEIGGVATNVPDHLDEETAIFVESEVIEEPSAEDLKEMEGALDEKS